MKSNRCDFGGDPVIIPMDEEATIALLGDWGTGDYGTDDAPAPSTQMRRYISEQLEPDYTIHLGDVYYSGNQRSEQAHFIDIFPAGKRGTFALNSNHEMHPGNAAYFENVLQDSNGKFAAQQGRRCFALVNDYFAVIGLDTAHSAEWRHGYSEPTLLDGSGGAFQSRQLAFVNQLASDPRGRQLILLSHHFGRTLLETNTYATWGQIVDAIKGTPSANKPVFWYWGHVHNGVIYAPSNAGQGITFMTRAAGHGAIPCTLATALQGAPRVVWFETEGPPPQAPTSQPPVWNGFVYLQLNKESLVESMIAQNGATRWTSAASR